MCCPLTRKERSLARMPNDGNAPVRTSHSGDTELGDTEPGDTELTASRCRPFQEELRPSLFAFAAKLMRSLAYRLNASLADIDAFPKPA
jgi:hypothetical protein